MASRPRAAPRVGLILLDSTVIVGFLDADDALHGVSVVRLREVVGSHPLVASQGAAIGVDAKALQV